MQKKSGLKRAARQSARQSIRRSNRQSRLLCNCVIITGFGLVYNAPARALDINLTFDSTVLDLPTTASYPGEPTVSAVETATQYAATQLDNLFSNNINI